MIDWNSVEMLILDRVNLSIHFYREGMCAEATPRKGLLVYVLSCCITTLRGDLSCEGFLS